MVKRVLCISGGGVRGACVAQFLKRLEENLPRSLYDTFDMYAGTSTGSLIVSSIAYKKKTGEELTNVLYSQENCEKIMSKSLFDDYLGTVQSKPKYENTGLQGIIDELAPENPRMSDTDKDVLITTFDVDKYEPLVLKSFKEKHNIYLKDAMCMSSSAPCYFPTFHNKQKDIYGIDGGVFANNPSDCTYAEALKLYGKNEDIRVLSIGTGYNYKTGLGKESSGFGGPEWLIQGDLINLFFKAPQKSVDYKMKTFTEALGHGYIHVDGKVECGDMDDTSEENINLLKSIGDQWWDSYKYRVLDLLK